MKFALVFAVLFGLASAIPTKIKTRGQVQTYTLRDDLNDYLALLPIDKLIALHEKAKQDPEAVEARNRVIAYLHTEEFAAVAHIIAHNDQIQDLVSYLESEGLHVIELLNKLADALGLPNWPTNFNAYSYSSVGNTRSLKSLLDELIALIPVEDFVALTLDKLANSESFQNLYTKIASMDGQKLHNDALSHPEIVSLIERLNNLGVDTKKIWGLLQTIFGWESYSNRFATTYTLRDDINDYLALIPFDKIKAIFDEALQDPENAAEFEKFKAYFHSEEFAAVAHIIAHNDQIQDLVNYIENEGLHVKELLNKLADRLGLPQWPESYSYSRSTYSTSFKDIFEKILALLPIDDFIALTLDKLANSESFQNFYMKIASMDGQKLHSDALKHPEIVSLIKKLNNFGVDTKKIWELLESVFGWGNYYSARRASTYTLRDDINDYLALLPMDKLIALHEKAKKDPESLEARNRVVAYLHSKEFAAIAHIIAYNDQIQDLVNYIEGEGLHVIELLNKLADRLGLPHWPSRFSAFNSLSTFKSTPRSLQNIVDEFIALIPVDDIIALTLDKLANSESFQNLYIKISSMDGQKLHDDALSHPEIVSLVERLNELGVDTKKVWGALKTIFGW